MGIHCLSEAITLHIDIQRELNSVLSQQPYDKAISGKARLLEKYLEPVRCRLQNVHLTRA